MRIVLNDLNIFSFLLISYEWLFRSMLDKVFLYYFCSCSVLETILQSYAGLYTSWLFRNQFDTTWGFTLSVSKRSIEKKCMKWLNQGRDDRLSSTKSIYFSLPHINCLHDDLSFHRCHGRTASRRPPFISFIATCSVYLLPRPIDFSRMINK